MLAVFGPGDTLRENSDDKEETFNKLRRSREIASSYSSNPILFRVKCKVFVQNVSLTGTTVPFINVPSNTQTQDVHNKRNGHEKLKSNRTAISYPDQHFTAGGRRTRCCTIEGKIMTIYRTHFHTIQSEFSNVGGLHLCWEPIS